MTDKVAALGSELREARQVKSREAMDQIFAAGCICTWGGDPAEPENSLTCWSIMIADRAGCPVHGDSATSAAPPEVTGAAGDCGHGVPGNLFCGACEGEALFFGPLHMSAGLAEQLAGQQHPGETKLQDGLVGALADVLAERGSRYGAFAPNARISQALKQVMWDTPNWLTMRDDQREALELIALKVSRILSGDADYADNWVDIAGYARLVSDDLARRAEVAA